MAKNKSDKKKLKWGQPSIFHEMADILNSNYAHEVAKCLVEADRVQGRDKANLIAEAQVYATLHQSETALRLAEVEPEDITAEDLGYTPPKPESMSGRGPNQDETVAPGVGG